MKNPSLSRFLSTNKAGARRGARQYMGLVNLADYFLYLIAGNLDEDAVFGVGYANTLKVVVDSLGSLGFDSLDRILLGLGFEFDILLVEVDGHLNLSGEVVGKLP